MSEQEMLDYLLSTGLYKITDEKRPYNDLFYEYRMIKTDKTVPIKDLVERFIEVDKEYNGEPWNIKQILANSNILFLLRTDRILLLYGVFNMQIIEIYEYGNGIYAEPFWDRVQKKIDKVEEEYEIINMNKKFIPSHYIGKNCMGMDVYRGDELFLTLYCKSK